MGFYVVQLLSLMLILMFVYLLYYGKKNSVNSVLSYRNTIVVIILYNLTLFFYRFDNLEVLNVILFRVVPILTALTFASLYMDFNKNPDISNENSNINLLVKIFPVIITFIFVIDLIRLFSSKFGDYIVEISHTIIDSFSFFVNLSLMVYQIAILLILLSASFKLMRKFSKRNYNSYMSISLVFIAVIVLNIILFSMGAIERNISFSAFIYSYLLLHMMVNHINSTESLSIQKEKSRNVERINDAVGEKVLLNDSEMFDGLTGLYNYSYFIKYLNEVEGYDNTFTVLVISLKGLKYINNSYGYESGNDILQELSIVVNEVFSEFVVARMRGGEFAVAFSGLTSEEINNRIESVKDICATKEGIIINLSFGKFRRVSLEISPVEVYLRARDDMYLEKEKDDVISQKQIANILHRNITNEMPVLSSHLKRCASMSREFSLFIELPEKYVSDLANAALVHDIAVTVLKNGNDYCADFANDHDVVVYKTHPSKGMDIIIEAGLNPNIAKIVLHHHELYDGSGYPYGLTNNSIPYQSQILSIVDFVDITINIEKNVDRVEELLLKKSNVEFSEELVYNMIAFLKHKNLIT